MKIKPFLIIIYTLAGFFISILSSLLTYIIIGKPIGIHMAVQIVFVVIFLTPVVGIISLILGGYLSGKFNFIKNRLEDIKNENYIKDSSQNTITEINDINDIMNFLSSQLKHLIEDLKRKNQDLSNLLISMAHDIKTPITILNGYIEELEDGMIGIENLPQALSQMKEETKFLDELAADMLEFITSMDGCKRKEKIELCTLVQNEIFPILPLKAGVRYLNELEKEFFVEFNKMDLKKIILNLFNNAIKHTKVGYVKIYNKNLIIIFENTGNKIDEEFKNKIFEPFFTIDKSRNRKKSGFGLGLSIVKNLCKNNGYTCTLHSSDMTKTLFYLTNQTHKKGTVSQKMITL